MRVEEERWEIKEEKVQISELGQRMAVEGGY